MVTIKLQNDYFIEIDELNATLKQKFTGKTKDGAAKESVRTIGYFNKPVDAIERFVVLNRLDKMDGGVLSLDEYVNALKQADAEVKEFLTTLQTGGE